MDSRIKIFRYGICGFIHFAFGVFGLLPMESKAVAGFSRYYMEMQVRDELSRGAVVVLDKVETVRFRGLYNGAGYFFYGFKQAANRFGRRVKKGVKMFFGYYQAVAMADREDVKYGDAMFVLVQLAGWQFAFEYFAENTVFHKTISF